MVIANATSIVTTSTGRGRARMPIAGYAIVHNAASATGNSTKAGRLSAVKPQRMPRAVNRLSEGDRSARTANSIDTVKTHVVHTSVLTSAPKYGIGAYSAVAAAAPTAIVSLSVASRA